MCAANNNNVFGGLMNRDQILARLKEISSRVEDLRKGTINADTAAEAKALGAEFKDLQAQLEGLDAMDAIMNVATVSERKTAPAATVKAVENKNEFKSYGDFLAAVKTSAINGKPDARFENLMRESVGEEGGFLVPENMGTEVQKVLASEESLLSRVRRFNVSSNNLVLPIDDKTPWSSGIIAYWIAEGDKYIESKTRFSTASWRLHKLGVLVKVTDELMEDSVALESYIRELAPQAIMHEVNDAIINGNGVGKPQGILNSSFKVVVEKENGQAADTITPRNVISMYSRMLPSSRAKAVWLIHPSAEEALRTMKDDNGNFIFLAPGSQLNNTPYATLLGRPVLPMLNAVNPIGDEGDIIFADLSYYYVIMKTNGMKQAVSTHVYFERDITAYKFTLRIDGKIPFKAPLETEKGNYKMSGIVTLEAR